MFYFWHFMIFFCCTDLKVDVHRKNSSDSSDEPSAKNDQVLIMNEVSQEKPVVGKWTDLFLSYYNYKTYWVSIFISTAKEPLGAKVTVTTSEEVLIEKNNPKSCRKRSLKENTSQDVSVVVVNISQYNLHIIFFNVLQIIISNNLHRIRSKKMRADYAKEVVNILWVSL